MSTLDSLVFLVPDGICSPQDSSFITLASLQLEASVFMAAALFQ